MPPCMCLSPVPELHVGPGNAQVTAAAIGSVSPQFVIEAAARCAVVPEHFLAVDVDAETVVVGVVHHVDAHAGADRRYAVGNRLATLDAVQPTALLHAHDEIWTTVPVERLLDRDAVARHVVDLEDAAKLVHPTAVVVLVPALGPQMAVGAAAASPAAVRRLWNGEGVTVDSASLALLR